MNCTGRNCIIQFDKVDPSTCKAVAYCPYATPPRTNADTIRALGDDAMSYFLYAVQSMRKSTPMYWLKWLKEEDTPEVQKMNVTIIERQEIPADKEAET